MRFGNSVGVFKKRILKRNILLKTLREERSLQQPEDNVVTATLSFCVTFVLEYNFLSKWS